MEHIQEVLAGSPWMDKGHREVSRAAASRGVRTSSPRVLRPTREQEPLAPRRPIAPRSPLPRPGDHPEATARMWATDAPSTLTDEGNATIFFVLDSCTAPCLGTHPARRERQLEAIEAPRQLVMHSFKTYGEGIGQTAGLWLRHDHGSPFVSDLFQGHLRFLRIDSCPSFAREPEGNGCEEPRVRTPKEQLLCTRRFGRLEELAQALQDSRKGYNSEWLVEWHGHRSPAARRAAAAA